MGSGVKGWGMTTPCPPPHHSMSCPCYPDYTTVKDEKHNILFTVADIHV